MKLLGYYKDFSRRIRRLPFERRTLDLLQAKTKNEFTNLNDGLFSYSSIDINKYNKYAKIFDKFLIDENYDALHEILDLAYKNDPPWVQQFQQINYLSFKNSWPQVHLVHEFGSKQSINKYDEQLAYFQSKKPQLDLFEYFNIDRKSLAKDRIRPLSRTTENESSMEELISKARKLFKFVEQNKHILCHYVLRDFEVVYEPTKFGLPGNDIKRDKELKKTINYIKQFIQMYRPIDEGLLNHLIKTAASSHDPNYKINHIFFKYMARKHEQEKISTSPLIRTYLRKKHLVPGEDSIKDILKDYARRQFYIDSNNDYRMSWIFNITDRQIPIEEMKLIDSAIEKQIKI